MQYIVDGHNLIGQCRSIDLGEPDDEAKLVAALHRWVLRQTGTSITVVFDGGVYGHPQALDRAGVRTVFAYSPQDADARLIRLIEHLGDPIKYRVVTNDRAVAAAAQDRGVQVVSATSFATQIEQRPSATRRTLRRQRPEPKLSRNEVDDWLREFGHDDTLVD